ncbi:MAG: CHAT domain-containing tetratricopeptide repeat protein [Nostoc sp.]|uniref:CHAT domain-containing protein n=1 Tax=Nostoc sp. TaxID=1180 RepID=UPI002FFD2D19
MPFEKGTTFNNIGEAYRKLGEYPRALASLQQARKIFKQISYKEGEGATLLNFGAVYENLGQYSKALEFNQQAREIFKQISYKVGEGNVLNNIGDIYRKLRDYSKALEFLRQGLEIRKQIEDKLGEFATLNNMGLVHYSLGEYPKALELMQKAVLVHKQIEAKFGEGTLINNIGSIYYSLGEYPEALKYYQQALAIHKQVSDKPGEVNTLANIGYVLLKTNKLTKSIEYLRAAIDAQELLRPGLDDADKISIIDTQRSLYQHLQQAYIAQNQREDALEISERGRARAFVELLAEKQKTQIQPKPSINQLKQIAKEQNATLVEYSIIEEAFKIEGKQEWRESQLYIWVIKPTGEVTLRQSDLKPLWQKDKINLIDIVSLTREAIGVRGRDPSIVIEATEADETLQKKRLQQLYKLLIDPIADLLQTKESDKIVFIPQSSLFLVPFPALQDRNGKYLIEKYTILTSPSIQLLDLTRQQKQRLGNTQIITKQDAVVVGNPIMPKVLARNEKQAQQLTPLPAAGEEAKAIAPILKTEAITGNKAKKSAILPLLAQAKIIHLATHGLLDDFKGLGVPGAIALAPSGNGEPNDGLLTANEILDLKLNAELVVLSACDTGRGRITGDGVIGLSRSLITAGVPSVIVSLWSVPDAPTAELMTEFYRNWLERKLDKAQALRQAMLTTMKTHPNPKDWAAFTLIGEAK